MAGLPVRRRTWQACIKVGPVQGCGTITPGAIFLPLRNNTRDVSAGLHCCTAAAMVELLLAITGHEAWPILYPTQPSTTILSSGIEDRITTSLISPSDHCMGSRTSLCATRKVDLGHFGTSVYLGRTSYRDSVSKGLGACRNR